MPDVSHDYLHELHDWLHDTPMKRKLRRLAPMPIGCVFIQWPSMTEQDVRQHFRAMREAGFTCLKGLMTCPGTSRQKLQHMAIDEGLSPWWYDDRPLPSQTEDSARRCTFAPTVGPPPSAALLDRRSQSAHRKGSHRAQCQLGSPREDSNRRA